MKRLFAFLAVFLMVTSIFVSLPESRSTTITTFENPNQASDVNVTFFEGGGIDATIAFQIPKGVKVIDANLNVTTKHSIKGESPTWPSLDIGTDGDIEWAYQGQGYGSYGNQNMFSDNITFHISSFSSPTGGTDTSVDLKFPQGAIITSAKIGVSGEKYLNSITERAVDSTSNMRSNPVVFDVDDDNDGDVVFGYSTGTSSDIRYQQNNGGGTSWSLKTIDSAFYDIRCIAVDDIDDDGDPDVIGGGGPTNPSTSYNTLEWFECPTDPFVGSWTVRTIGSSTNAGQVFDLVMADMNGDNHKDAVCQGVTTQGDQIYWFERPSTPTTTPWQKTTVVTNFNTGMIDVGDIDLDGDNDIAFTTTGDDGGLYWYENVDTGGPGSGDGSTWNLHLITTGLNQPSDIEIEDMDQDGDPDFVLAIKEEDNIAWWDNLYGNSLTWFRRFIGHESDPKTLNVTDLDGNGFPDITITTYTNKVVWYHPSQDTSAPVWVEHILDNSISGALGITCGDVSGDNIPDPVATCTSSSPGVLWYEFSGIYPTNPLIDVNSDGNPEWSLTGLFNTFDTTEDFTAELNTIIPTKTPSAPDAYGHSMVTIPVKFQCSSYGTLAIYNLNITYNYVSSVDPETLAEELNELIPNKGSGNVDIHCAFRTKSAGPIGLDDLAIEFNTPPNLNPNIPDLILDEDSIREHAIDLHEYFEDDYDPDEALTFTIKSNSKPDKVDVSIVDDHYLEIDATKVANWFGQIQVNVSAKDNGRLGTPPLTRISNLFTITVIPINDKPFVGSVDIPDITMKEGSYDTSIDLSLAKYFEDIDSTTLYYFPVVDPLNQVFNENLTADVNNVKNKLLEIHAKGDWWGDVTVRVYCNDMDLQEKGSTIYQDVTVHVLNVNDDPPWFDPLGELHMDEDSDDTDWINLNDFVHDIDNDEFTYEVVSNTNETHVNVSVAEDGLVTVGTSTKNFVGRSTVIVSAFDGDNYAYASFEVYIEPVNDPPSIEILGPQDTSMVSGVTLIHGYAHDVEGIDYVEIKIGSNNWVKATGQAVWQYIWETEGISEGDYTISVRAYDGEIFSTIVQISVEVVSVVQMQDIDSDGDGAPDTQDAFPNNPEETMDSDNDGVGDNVDAFPFDPTETKDTDYDGFGDNKDEYPLDPTNGKNVSYDKPINKLDEDEDAPSIWWLAFLLVAVVVVAAVALAVKVSKVKKIQERGKKKRGQVMKDKGISPPETD